MKALLLTSLLLLVPSAASAASAATPANPKIVFVGDQVTSLWPLTQTNPNWINQGQVNARAGNVAASFQTVINLHPNVIHILVGEVDQSLGDMGMEPVLAIPGFLSSLQTMVSEARAAKIQVVLGMEPSVNGLPLNDVVSAYGAQQGIPVINYQNVATTVNNSYIGNQIPTAAGYQQMTALLENVLPTVNLQLGGGYLQNTSQQSGGAPVFTNVNTVNPASTVTFTAVGWYNNGSLQQQINTNLVGATGTWTSSNPLVMTIGQGGGAAALTPGTTIIRYTSLNGVAFSEWIMYVVPYGG
jgi:hypothetical protein